MRVVRLASRGGTDYRQKAALRTFVRRLISRLRWRHAKTRGPELLPNRQWPQWQRARHPGNVAATVVGLLVVGSFAVAEIIIFLAVLLWAARYLGLL